MGRKRKSDGSGTGAKLGFEEKLWAAADKMRGRLDPSWHRFLWTFLVSPFGPNYPNELLHGFVDEVTRSDAGFVLIAALHLSLTPEREQTDKASRTGSQVGSESPETTEEEGR